MIGVPNITAPATVGARDHLLFRLMPLFSFLVGMEDVHIESSLIGHRFLLTVIGYLVALAAIPALPSILASQSRFFWWVCIVYAAASYIPVTDLIQYGTLDGAFISMWQMVGFLAITTYCVRNEEVRRKCLLAMHDGCCVAIAGYAFLAFTGLGENLSKIGSTRLTHIGLMPGVIFAVPAEAGALLMMLLLFFKDPRLSVVGNRVRVLCFSGLTFYVWHVSDKRAAILGAVLGLLITLAMSSRNRHGTPFRMLQFAAVAALAVGLLSARISFLVEDERRRGQCLARGVCR